MMTRRSWLVYGTLLAIWVLLVGWQVAEHARVKRSASVALVNRAKDISNTLGLLMRSQRFFGVVSKERLEPALNELVKHGELMSVALLNATNEEVASAGAPLDLQLRDGLLKDEYRRGEFWNDEAQTLTLMNLVDLGTNVVMSTSEIYTNRPPRGSEPPPPPRDGPEGRPPQDHPDGPPHRADNPPSEVRSANSTNSPPDDSRRNRRRRGDVFERPFERPFWMKEEEYNAIIQKRGVHGFIMVLSTQAMLAFCRQDLWMRGVIGLLATVSVLGSGLAWRSFAKNSELQIRLVRASELNSHLKEMNLAAAGLAHETRNPLNIIRGLAQMISKQEEASPEVRTRSRDIIAEADRVASQLNEFINYSRPRELRRVSTNLNSVVAEVVRALNYDIEEKKVQVGVGGDALYIEADEQLLRQALFNLVINAIQAVGPGGEINIRTGKSGNVEGFIEIADNGPGVAPEHRGEIFKPYFTTHQKGTGLGLAVVQQIVSAHGWEIACQASHPSGALFRISHLRIMLRS